MPHYFDTGFSVREPLWHGLGSVLDEYPGRELAMQKAGHAFEIVEHKIAPVDADGLPIDSTIEGWKALLRSDNKHTLACVRNSYQVLQPKVLWDVLDAIVNQPNVQYETAGVLKGGTIMWALARLDEPTLLKGKAGTDPSAIYPYVFTSTSHDGLGSLKAAQVSVRIVCWNTFRAAENQSKKEGREFTFRHTGKVMDRIEEAREVLAGVRANHQRQMEELQELLGIKITAKQKELFVTQFIPSPPETMISDRVMRNVEEARHAVRQILQSKTCDGVENSAYGLVQAAVEYLDYYRDARTNESRFRRSLLQLKPFKEQAATLARAVAKA